MGMTNRIRIQGLFPARRVTGHREILITAIHTTRRALPEPWYAGRAADASSAHVDYRTTRRDRPVPAAGRVIFDDLGGT